MADNDDATEEEYGAAAQEVDYNEYEPTEETLLLIAAAVRGNVDRVAECIENGGDKDGPDDEVQTINTPALSL
jgi:hypothetical protein